MKREPIDSGVTADQIDRYLAGGCDPDEATRVRTYLTSHPALERYHRALRLALQPAFDRTTIDAERSFAALNPSNGTPTTSTSHRVLVPDETSVPVYRRAPRSRGHARWARVSLFTGAALGMVLLIGSHLRRASSAVSDTIASRTYRTGAGRQAILTLGDGSRVTLAAQTTLVVSPEFGAQTRTVALTGEAYFEVAPGTRVPFLVRTGGVTTRVLGTAFDVKRYRDDPYVRVVVASGRVSSGGQRAPVILSAGTLGRVTDSTALATTVPDASVYTSWMRGRLAFWNTPVSDVLRTVGQWYGLEFRLADTTLASREVTVTLDHKSEAEAIRILNLLLDVTPTFGASGTGTVSDTSTRIITLHPRHRTGARPRRDISDSLFPFKEVGR